MGSPVCVAEKVWTASRREPATYILRWYVGGIGVGRNRCYVSAQLGGIRVHVPYASEVPTEVWTAAGDAFAHMKSGLWGDVLAMATHRWRWSWLTLRRELVPIAVPIVCDGMPGRDPDQPHAVCGRLDRHGEHPLGEVGRG